MNLVDTHCHLTFDGLADQVSAVLTRAADAGVPRVITIGTDAGDTRAAQALAGRHNTVFFAAGIHPHEAAKATDDDIAAIERAWNDPKCVAVGEIGLDYHYDFSPRDAQQRLFRRLLDVAYKTHLPVIIHSREAHNDTIAILRDAGYENRPVVFHCFGGTPDEAAQLRALGWWTSFTGTVTFKKADATRQACRETPADQLLLETDAPYLSPEPVRKVRPNEPAHLLHTARFVAALRGEPLETVAAQTTTNAERFFARIP
jgi:TatD DNase family protein